MAILSLDLQVWPWPSTYSNKCFKMALLLLKENTCAKLFWYPCINVKVMAWISSIYLTFKCDLDLQPTQTNVLNGTTTPQGEHLCKAILISMHKCRSYGLDKLNLWPFYHLTFKCDLNHQPTQTNVSNGITTPQGDHLCIIILKSMHNCRSYCPGMLNLWPFYHLTFKCDLDLQPTQTNVSNATTYFQGEHLSNIILKSMNKCRCYDPD